MTQEEKDLLIKDLCARLPYGVKTEIKYYDGVWELLAIYTNGTTYATRDIGYPIETLFEDCKPYLFPISSMTEEQKEEFNTRSLELQLKVIDDEIMYEKATEFEVDFYNKHHLDWRGLIPKGLALDATGLNIY